MPEIVTIEGSLTPSVGLARGERRTCQLTEHVQRLIDRGYVTVVKTEYVPPAEDYVYVEPVPEPEPARQPESVSKRPRTVKTVELPKTGGAEQLADAEEQVEVWEPGDVEAPAVDIGSE